MGSRLVQVFRKCSQPLGPGWRGIGAVRVMDRRRFRSGTSCSRVGRRESEAPSSGRTEHKRWLSRNPYLPVLIAENLLVYLLDQRRERQKR